MELGIIVSATVSRPGALPAQVLAGEVYLGCDGLTL